MASGHGVSNTEIGSSGSCWLDLRRLDVILSQNISWWHGWFLFNLIFITSTFQNQKTVSPDATPHQSKQSGVLRGFGHTARATQPNYCIMSRVMAVVKIWSYRLVDYVCYDPRLPCPRQSDMMLIHLWQVWWCRKEFCSWLCFGLVQFPVVMLTVD